jgi:hypothetical protein
MSFCLQLDGFEIIALLQMRLGLPMTNRRGNSSTSRQNTASDTLVSLK